MSQYPPSYERLIENHIEEFEGEMAIVASGVFRQFPFILCHGIEDGNLAENGIIIVVKDQVWNGGPEIFQTVREYFNMEGAIVILPSVEIETTVLPHQVGFVTRYSTVFSMPALIANYLEAVWKQWNKLENNC